MKWEFLHPKFDYKGILYVHEIKTTLLKYLLETVWIKDDNIVFTTLQGSVSKKTKSKETKIR